jgi:hypothetical protein
MFLGALTPQLVRGTYLRGIDLGAAWSGPSADAAIATLLLIEVARAEALMNIHFRRWRVATLPADAAVLGTDYDVLGQPLPFTPLPPPETLYHLKLTHHDVHAVTRVRLFLGMSTDTVPVPLYATVPLDTLTFPMPEERLLIPATLVPPAGVAWAIDYIMGMATLPPEIEAWCAMGAAMEVLSLGGSATDVSHGLGGESLMQDGIEEKVSYGHGSQWQGGGIYAGPITILERRRADIDLVALRLRYQNTLGDRTQLPADAVIPQRVPLGT